MKLFKEYPATHSMSTSWFAIDEEGKVAILNFEDNGPIPQPASGSQTGSHTLITDGQFTSAATLDLTTGEVMATANSSSMLLTLKDATITDVKSEYLEVYMTILPVSLNSNGNSLRAVIVDKNGLEYTATLPAKDFVAGTIYNIGRSAKLMTD